MYPQAKWTASPTADVVLYRIYKKRRLVDEVLAGSPLVFKTRVCSLRDAESYIVVL